MRRTMLVLMVAMFASGLLRASPIAANPLTGVASVAIGGAHTCAVTNAGGLKCWGVFQPGGATPADIVGLTSGVASAAAGDKHTCALTSTGGVKCRGDNTSGQLGDGQACGTVLCNTPVDVSGLTSGVTAITAAAGHTCALTTTGGLKCWGFNASGQLGDGTTDDRSTPVDVVGLASGIAAVDAGTSHTCAVTTLGSVTCWGANFAGQLGDGTTTEQHSPVAVSGLTSGVATIAAGYVHTCAVTIGGGGKCWGGNNLGQLGDGTTDDRSTPVDVVGLGSGVAAVTAGGSHTCALTTGGGVTCWGENLYGQLGDGTTAEHHTPVAVSGLASGVTAIGVGGSHSCALTSAAGVKCWGSNDQGQLGDGTTCCGSPPHRATPVDVVELLKYTIGDVDCSDEVTSIDALFVLQVNAGFITVLACDDAADVDESGVVDSIDALLILQYVAGFLDEL